MIVRKKAGVTVPPDSAEVAEGQHRGAEGPGAEACGCRKKATPRSEETQKDLQNRLNRVIGQLNGVKAMIDDNRYCGDVLVQLAAAQSAVRRISEQLLRDHMNSCVIEEIRAGDEERARAVVAELSDLMRKFS